MLRSQLLKALDDSRPRTATQLAQLLTVSQNEVLRAMRALLEENAVLVSGFVHVTHGGRRPRAFVSTGAAGIRRQLELSSSSSRTRWPAADAVLHSAMEAIVRQDAPRASGSAAADRRMEVPTTVQHISDPNLQSPPTTL
jgi:predicted ArsR family transcriptional regulator